MSSSSRQSLTAYIALAFFLLGVSLLLHQQGWRPSMRTSPAARVPRTLAPGTIDLPASCAEVLAIDRPVLRAKAERSYNFPSTTCERLILQRCSQAKSWRRATWAKIDVLHQHKKTLAKYEFILVRDIDTKINASFVMELLPRHDEKKFGIGFVQMRKGSRCESITAVTNWFAYWNGSCHRGRNPVVNAWRKSKRKQTDQYIFNEKLLPCCRNDALCVDKCIPLLNEVHCRRGQGVQKQHYGDQDECIENCTTPMHAFYHTTADYRCDGDVGYVDGRDL